MKTEIWYGDEPVGKYNGPPPAEDELVVLKELGPSNAWFRVDHRRMELHETGDGTIEPKWIVVLSPAHPTHRPFRSKVKSIAEAEKRLLAAAVVRGAEIKRRVYNSSSALEFDDAAVDYAYLMGLAESGELNQLAST